MDLSEAATTLFLTTTEMHFPSWIIFFFKKRNTKIKTISCGISKVTRRGLIKWEERWVFRFKQKSCSICFVFLCEFSEHSHAVCLQIWPQADRSNSSWPQTQNEDKRLVHLIVGHSRSQAGPSMCWETRVGRLWWLQRFVPIYKGIVVAGGCKTLILVIKIYILSISAWIITLKHEWMI